MSTPRASSPEGPGCYQIRLTGRLDPRWATRFEGMALTSVDGVTLLEGQVVDQSALHGLLRRLRDTGLPLVSVGRVQDHDEITTPLTTDTTHATPRHTSQGA